MFSSPDNTWVFFLLNWQSFEIILTKTTRNTNMMKFLIFLLWTETKFELGDRCISL